MSNDKAQAEKLACALSLYLYGRMNICDQYGLMLPPGL